MVHTDISYVITKKQTNEMAIYDAADLGAENIQYHQL